MKEFGYVRVAAANLDLKVANPAYNLIDLKKKIDEAVENKVDVLCFPELCLSGYTCNDLFEQDLLLEECLNALKELAKYSIGKDLVFIVGTPLKIGSSLFNCAVVIKDGIYLGITCKTYLPNYREFYEKRWFESGNNLAVDQIVIDNQTVVCGIDLLFRSGKLCFGIEICEDLWSVNPLSNEMVLNGANVIFNPSASNEIAAKNAYRKELVKMQSAKGICAYVYISANANESSTDLLFSGAGFIFENGTLLREGERFLFDGKMIKADVDLARLENERLGDTSFSLRRHNKSFRIIEFALQNKNQSLERVYSKTPFVLENISLRRERCNEILNIQSTALAKRLKHIGCKKTVIGLSGGLDSTLAFLVTVKANKILNISNDNIIAITMPGFGTTDRTYDNALRLAEIFGATLKEIRIKDAVIQHFKDISHNPDIHDITYENAQARERTQILMDVANQENGLVIGTGDLSELALGWCTYNGDHMSMYGVNASVPKTLVKYLVEFVKDEDENCREVLRDILDTPISPELLPPDEQGNIAQKTEDSIGPYLLHDFFIYHFLRYKANPKKIFYLAKHTFKDEFDDETILKWLKVFIRRFFTQQFKRSCMPDGVKVGTISLSPRGDLRMPSDASCEIWLKDLEEIKL